ncbi:MAG: hypothetical protein SGI88_16395 [Candidatus Hydrogenedentes bacterium]|nr:hypothetical protein [Candidatus Hydrogenedentota bacterium]
MRCLAATLAMLLVFAGCGPSGPTPVETSETSTAVKPVPAAKAPLPADVPVPAELANRSDSTVAGSDYHVVQGQLAMPMGDAIATVRKQAASTGWVEKPQQGAAPVASVTTHTFTKDSRQLTVTLAMVDPTSTSVNLMTGPQ